MTGVSHIRCKLHTKSFCAPVPSWLCRLSDGIQNVFSLSEKQLKAGQLSFRTEIIFLRCCGFVFCFFFGSIQYYVSEILSIIKNMTWIYYGSQLQFLNTLVRLVSNIFLSQRDREEEREHQAVISWGWMGTGMGKAMPERVSSDGAQTFLMDYLSWKHSTWKILPQGAHCQQETAGSPDEPLYACYVGLRVELPGQGIGITELVLLSFYDRVSSGDLQGSKKVGLWQLF